MKSDKPSWKLPPKGKPLEKTIEHKVVEYIESLGGKCWKFVSPSETGVPDRIVLLPGGVVGFLEMKRPGEKPSDKQELVLSVLSDLDVNADWAESLEEVQTIIQSWMK